MPVMSVLRKPWSMAIDGVEGWIKRAGKDIPTETDWTDSTKASWYISPRQHAKELVVLSTGFASATLYYLTRILDRSSTTWKLLSAFKPVGKATKAESLLIATLAGSFSVTLIHKIIRKNKLFMLQPCHMSAGLLLLTLCNPNKSNMAANLFFNIYLHTQWGAIAALIFPDLRDHYLVGETVNFFVEHLLILIAPVYMIYSGRYLVLPLSRSMTMLSFFIYSFYHSPLLHLCAIKSRLNLNYLYSPPPIDVLLRIGKGYRVALYATALGAMFTTRYGLVENLMSVIPRKSLALITQ